MLNKQAKLLAGCKAVKRLCNRFSYKKKHARGTNNKMEIHRTLSIGLRENRNL